MGMVITMQESSPAPRGSLPELCTFGGIALADMIRRRKVSAEEVMATYLEHIGRTNPAVNAIISLRHPLFGLTRNAYQPSLACARKDSQTVRTVEPVVLRAARSAWAFAASFSG
jgi:hypothetical protein